jgi:hypothetical protein
VRRRSQERAVTLLAGRTAVSALWAVAATASAQRRFGGVEGALLAGLGDARASTNRSGVGVAARVGRHSFSSAAGRLSCRRATRRGRARVIRVGVESPAAPTHAKAGGGW